jgi:hypothetical protein
MLRTAVPQRPWPVWDAQGVWGRLASVPRSPCRALERSIQLICRHPKRLNATRQGTITGHRLEAQRAVGPGVQTRPWTHGPMDTLTYSHTHTLTLTHAHTHTHSHGLTQPQSHSHTLTPAHKPPPTRAPNGRLSLASRPSSATLLPARARWRG